MFNIGIIGCGKIAQVRHLPEYKANKNVKIYGLFDINAERTKTLAEEFDAKAFDSYEALLADENIHAVSVCSSNNTHAKITIEALKAGKHVLCEKPMATSIEDCEAMVKTAKETGKHLMIGHNQRLAKAHAKARKLITDGAIGDIISFRTTFGHSGPETWSVDPGKNVWFYDKTTAYLGSIGDLGIHKTDLIQFLTGQKVSEVTAKLSTLDKRDGSGNLIGVDDNAMCIYTMENGIVGTLASSWTFYGDEDNSTILYGTKGIMRIYDDKDYSITITNSEGESIFYNIDKIQTNDNQTASGVIDLFVECLVNDTAPEISGEEAMSAMRAVFACVTSSETGKSIKL